MGNCLPCFDRRAIEAMDKCPESVKPEDITVRALCPDDGPQVEVPIVVEEKEEMDSVALMISNILMEIKKEEDTERNDTVALVIEEMLAKVVEIAETDENETVTAEVTKKKKKSRFRFFKRKSSKKAAEKAASACDVVGDMVVEEEKKVESAQVEMGEGEMGEGPKDASNGPNAEGADC